MSYTENTNPIIERLRQLKQKAEQNNTLITNLKTPQPAYSYQDIVTFVDTAGHTITHRIIKVANKNGTTSFTTKGDNNKTEDTEAITQSQIIGKYQTRLPRAGYLLINMQRPLGTVLIILLPLVVVFTPELLKEKQPTHDKKP